MGLYGERYLVVHTREVEVSTEALCKIFDAEWEEAKEQGKTPEQFARECCHEVDFEDLVDVGDRSRDDWDVIAL